MRKLGEVDRKKLFEEKKKSLVTIITGYKIKKEMLELFETAKNENKKYEKEIRELIDLGKKINKDCDNALSFEKDVKNEEDLMELGENLKLINSDYVKLANKMDELDKKMEEN